MAYSITTDVTTSAEGLTRIQIIDPTGEQPTWYLFERPAQDGHVIWFGPKGSAFALNQEQLYEALPFLLSFLETGRLVKR